MVNYTRAIIIIVTHLITQQSVKAQNLTYNFVLGTVSSRINGKARPLKLIENNNKVGYLFQFELNKKIDKRIDVLIGIGYIRLGGVQLLDGGYAQDNADFSPYFVSWSVLRNKAYYRLNYIKISSGFLYKISKKLKVGITIDGLLFSQGSIKSKFYVSGQSADYSQIFWERGKTVEPIYKFLIAPQFHLQYNLTNKIGLRFSYLNSISSIYKNSKQYHQAISLTSIIDL